MKFAASCEIASVSGSESACNRTNQSVAILTIVARFERIQK